MKFDEWLDTLVEEKGYDVENCFYIDGETGVNIISLSVVIESIKNTCQSEKIKIKDMLVKIDFLNGSCLHYFKHLASALV